MVGIYKITSPSGKVYIGQSWDIKERFRGYKKPSWHGKQPFLFNSFNKYGIGNHQFDIAHTLPHDIDQKTLDIYEVFYWEQYKECGFKMMNAKEPGMGGKLSEETKNKMSAKAIGRKTSEETKKKISAFFKGRKNPLCSLKGEENGFYGKAHSENTKNKLSNHAKLRVSDKNSFYGKRHSDETKKKISDKNKGKPVSDYCKQRSSETHKGKPKSEESKRKLSASLMGHKSWNKGNRGLFTHSEKSKKLMSDNRKGKSGRLGMKHSEETKKKMSEDRKGRHSGDKNPNFGNKARLAAADRKLGKISYSFGHIN